MPKKKWNLNEIYVSERLQESLRPISGCVFTSVVAPMGYGKTTAINWYLEERAKAENIKVVRISVYSDNLMLFWKSVQDALARAGFDFLLDYPYPSDEAGGAFLADALCNGLAGETAVYAFIDDFHLITDSKVADYLCILAKRLPKNVHMIVASRDRFLPASGILRLGNSVYQIGIEKLRLNHTELAVYSHRCGMELTEDQIKDLLYFSEGWFSAIYINLCTLYEQGRLPDNNSDIYAMFIAALIDPLSQEQREFLAVMGMADEFTAEMAEFVTGRSDTEDMLNTLTRQNAFVTRLNDGQNYRFHHMMKECAQRVFATLDKTKQSEYLRRFGDWYVEKQQYIQAMDFYRRSESYDELLEVVQIDAGILLSSIKPDLVLSELDNCPAWIIKRHPFAILVLMRCMFNWRMIPKMMELKGLLMQAISENPDMDPAEKGNLLGECDLITSFLMYNDISAMSRLHRSASAQMSGIAISLSKNGGWTFGSPSVLMMFHREPGNLEKELTEMDECMPHYYKVTDGHGMGAEKIMRAEALLMQGRFDDSRIEMESAYPVCVRNGQTNMTLCCDFTGMRLTLCSDIQPRGTLAQRYEELLNHHNIAYINIWNATCAYYYSLTGELDKIPEIFREHRLSGVDILAPGRPMHEMIENQVYLAQGDYARVIGRCEGLLKVCEELHYALVKLHLLIQTAAAYERLGKEEKADEFLKMALEYAMPDSFLMPFVENYKYLKPVLERVGDASYAEFINRIAELGIKFEKRIGQKKESPARSSALAILTRREYDIVALMDKRLTNKEIAEKLFLSEGSVKQYINQIFSKLEIDGDRRTKRERLFEMYHQKV